MVGVVGVWGLDSLILSTAVAYEALDIIELARDSDRVGNWGAWNEVGGAKPDKEGRAGDGVDGADGGLAFSGVVGAAAG